MVTERPRLAVAEHPALPNGYRDVLEGGRQALRVLAYLRGRGLDEPAIARLRPGYTFAAPGKGAPDLRGRAIIPLTVGGDVVFWVARALGAVEPKILNPKTPAGGKPLWGLDDLPQGSDVTLVEGPFDAAATPFGTAMLGTALTERQVWQLRRHRPSSVMIMMDGDEPGRAAEPALVRQVSEDVGVQPTVARVPWGRDPGDLSRGGMDVALASATVTTPLSAAIGRLREGGCRR